MNVVVKEFSDQTWANFKSVAAKRNKTLKALLEEVVRDYLEQSQK